MTLAHLCQCGTPIPLHRARCANCERTRNQQPHRQAHHSNRHYQLRRLTLIRDGFKCVDCGTSEDLTLDYITPLQDGGTQTLPNAATRCRTCNARKGRY